MANFFRSVLLRLQGKTVTAGTSASTVTVDTGYDGLSSVTVNPTPSETKTQAPSTTAIDVTPSSGKLLSKVTVSAIPTETKSQAAGTSNIDVTPTSGKYLTKVTITPQQHSGYYPASGSNITTNGTKDLGASHNYRYVNVNVPSPTLSGDAAVGNVLSGKTFYNTSTTKQTGTMTNNGAVSPSGLNCGGSYTIPAGYHNGSGVVTANSLSSQTGVDSGKTAVTAGAMLSGYQGWVNGSKISGNISSKAAATYNTSSSDQTISSGQYLSGAQTIKAVTTSGISAANIKDGAVVKVGDANSATRIANVTGTFTDASTVSSGQTAAAAAQIRTGYSAWVDGAEVKGSIANLAATTYNTSSSDQTIASGKYINGTQTIKAVTTSGISAANIKDGAVVKVGDANSATRIANVTGTFTDATTVSSGQTAAAAAQIKSGYSAWVDGAEVKGSYTEPTITSITPSNSSPVYLDGGKNYSIPSGESGRAISTYKTITPSDTYPVQLWTNMVSDGSNGFYKVETNGGYAIQSYQSKTPSADGVQFDEGFVKMSTGGYAITRYTSIDLTYYGQQVRISGGILKVNINTQEMSSAYIIGGSVPSKTETILWTSSSPSTAISDTTITLTGGSITTSNFTYVKFIFRMHKDIDTDVIVMYPTSEFIKSRAEFTSSTPTCTAFTNDNKGNSGYRLFYYSSATQVVFKQGKFHSSASGSMGGSNNLLIPKQIVGIKYSGV